MVNGRKVVCIGGGTGLSTLLKGIKEYVNSGMPDHELIDLDELVAIVSVADDGGSSGRLIDEFGILPPGDIRNCMVALADESELLTKLFSFRFQGSGPLGGHSLGNLLLTALTQMFDGNFQKAVEVASRVLSIRGRILPVSLDNTILCAQLEDGTIVEGQSYIPKRTNRSPIKRVFLKPRNGEGEVKAHPEAVEAIMNADAIIIGPGSLYTSVMPNLALPEISDALSRSEAIKIYVCNVMAEPGETDGYTVSDHVQAVLDHAPMKLDYVLVNSAIAPEELIKQYIREELLEQFNRIKAQAEEAISAIDGEFGNCRLEELMEISLRIAELSRNAHKIADPLRVQILYREEVDGPRLKGIKVIQEDMIRGEMIRDKVDGAIVRKKVIRHDPIKLAGVIVRILKGEV
ncbi:hypothetical protein DRP77_09430 [Candidatus Poribacteria bacterium]|nr:MAG: hypothetical protein DRP77_09430 [Candidatus Poribacteria bacterium]